MAMFPIIALGVFLALAFFGFRVLPEYERGVIFRLGRFTSVKGAGLKWIIPIVDRMVRIGLREIVMDVPPQEVITRDNVSVTVNAVVYRRMDLYRRGSPLPGAHGRPRTVESVTLAQC